MPWQLTTPISVGSFDPNAPNSQYTYCRVKLRGTDTDRERSTVNIEYGWLVSGEFVAGVVPTNRKSGHLIEGARWLDMTNNSVPKVEATNPGGYAAVDVGGTTVYVEKTYVATKRGLYEFLAAEPDDQHPGNNIIPPGSLV